MLADDISPERRKEMLHNNALRGEHMKGHAAAIEHEVRRMIAGWGDQGEIDLLEFFAELTIYTSSACLIGTKFRNQLDSRFAHPLLHPGVLSMEWGSAIRARGAGLGIEVDEITDTCELDWASEDFDVSAGRIPRGGVAAMRFEICGWSRGKRALVIEHVTRLRPDQRPDWPQPAQTGGSYRVEIIGEPSFVVDICQTSALGDHNYAAIAAGAGRIVNAIPAVVAAEPGLHTALDLPLVSGRGIPSSNSSGDGG